MHWMYKHGAHTPSLETVLASFHTGPPRETPSKHLGRVQCPPPPASWLPGEAASVTLSSQGACTVTLSTVYYKFHYPAYTLPFGGYNCTDSRAIRYRGCANRRCKSHCLSHPARLPTRRYSNFHPGSESCMLQVGTVWSRTHSEIWTPLILGSVAGGTVS